MNRIVQIAGTSGSGKSTIVREFVRKYHGKPEFRVGRKAPLGYHIPYSVFVVGAYEAPSAGGCDTFGSEGPGLIERVYSLLYERERESDVVFEGIMMMNHMRGLELWRKTKALSVILLTTPLRECIAAVEARRVNRGRPAKFRTGNLEGNYKRTEMYCAKLRAEGGPIYECSRDEAPQKLEDLLCRD